MTSTRLPGTAVATIAVFLLVGCTGASGPGTASDPAGPAVPASTPTPDPVPVGIGHPTGPDDVLLRIETGGGFVPVEYSFTQQPTLLLTGDGRLLLPPTGRDRTRMLPVDVAQLDEEQVQELLGLADEAGLLSDPPDYEDITGAQVADAPTTTVTLGTSAGTWVHAAYALGLDDGSGPRAALGSFIDAAVAATAGVEVARFQPEALALHVQPTDLDREVVAWPDDDVALADVAGCQVVPATPGLLEALSTSGLVVSFSQDGALYSVSGAEVLPGDQPCS